MNDDELTRALRELPEQTPSGHRAHGKARAEFVRVRTRSSPWDIVASTGRLGLPIGLASVIAIYLSWAFTTATALYR